VRDKITALDQKAAEELFKEIGINTYYARLSIFQVLANEPKFAKALSDLLNTLLFSSNLEHELRELVIMRIAWKTKSVYEWTQHWTIALSFGVKEDELLAIRDFPKGDIFSDKKRYVLKAVDETIDEGKISDDTWKKLIEYFSLAELIDLTASIGAWHMVSGVLKSLDIDLETGTEPWPPDGLCP
jgi:alkylhydroperoxidase family enzyme